ncbi:MAG: hypothetical protein FWB88_06325 [Defluviitaleaceae bacterium]|nr:hypothetical protein [Defluviitaleaceae bacterium]MCL2239151.1 hypothetical protein [Defluviitaleaceae bacterium]
MSTHWKIGSAEEQRGGKLRQLFEAHNAAQKNAQNQRRPRPKTGTVRLSNTDSLRTAMAMRRRVLAKLGEVAAAVDVEKRIRDAMVATVKMQLDKIDRQIANIKRRERALREEQQARRDECPNRRRRRRADMQEQSVRIRRDMLYPAKEGGFDPRKPFGFPSTHHAPAPAVAFDVGGTAGIAMDAPAPEASMEVVL